MIFYKKKSSSKMFTLDFVKLHKLDCHCFLQLNHRMYIVFRKDYLFWTKKVRSFKLIGKCVRTVHLE